MGEKFPQFLMNISGQQLRVYELQLPHLRTDFSLSDLHILFLVAVGHIIKVRFRVSQNLEYSYEFLSEILRREKGTFVC